jgi:hypothetical protein
MTIQLLNGPTIAINTSLSSPLTISGGNLFRLITPPEWTPAAITFQISYDSTNYYNVYTKECKELVLPITAAACIVFGAYFQEIVSMKIRSGTMREPIVQLQQRTFSVVLNTKPDNSLPAGGLM